MDIMIHHLYTSFKSLILIGIVWFTDVFVLQIASLSIINPLIREFFVEAKDIISVVVSLSIFILTVVKIVNEIKKGKSKDQDKR